MRFTKNNKNKISVVGVSPNFLPLIPIQTMMLKCVAHRDMTYTNEIDKDETKFSSGYPTRIKTILRNKNSDISPFREHKIFFEKNHHSCDLYECTKLKSQIQHNAP